MRRLLFLTASLAALVAFAAVPLKLTYKARLSPVAMDTVMRSTVAGLGASSATLTGTQLVVTGDFHGLLSPAIAVKIHRGVATGVHGPAVLYLQVDKAQQGTLSGAVTLTKEQILDLQKGRLYIQIDSEKAPEGNLWGWLLR